MKKQFTTFVYIIFCVLHLLFIFGVGAWLAFVKIIFILYKM